MGEHIQVPVHTYNLRALDQDAGMDGRLAHEAELVTIELSKIEDAQAWLTAKAAVYEARLAMLNRVAGAIN